MRNMPFKDLLLYFMWSNFFKLYAIFRDSIQYTIYVELIFFQTVNKQESIVFVKQQFKSHTKASFVKP